MKTKKTSEIDTLIYVDGAPKKRMNILKIVYKTRNEKNVLLRFFLLFQNRMRENVDLFINKLDELKCFFLIFVMD